MTINHHQRPGHTALRRGRHSMPGQIYLITFTTHQRQPLFVDNALAMTAAAAIDSARIWRVCRLHAWVLMPDHWHGLVELGDCVTLASLIRSLKANTARLVRETRPEIARVWATGYHDHALRTDEALRDVAHYIVLNPVRAGLVRRVGDYPFWNAAWL